MSIPVTIRLIKLGLFCRRLSYCIRHDSLPRDPAERGSIANALDTVADVMERAASTVSKEKPDA